MGGGGANVQSMLDLMPNVLELSTWGLEATVLSFGSGKSFDCLCGEGLVLSGWGKWEAVGLLEDWKEIIGVCS